MRFIQFALYEAYGTRPTEWGSDPDRFKANTKQEEKSLGLLNERHRYRDLETGTFLTRDPIGYKDGPNIYCYVHGNPITHFDALGLWNAWNPLTWGSTSAASWSIRDSFNPRHESACWAETGAGLKEGYLGGAAIVTDTFTPNIGIFDQVHQDAEAFDGPGAGASRLAAAVSFNAACVASGQGIFKLESSAIIAAEIYGGAQTLAMGGDLKEAFF